MCPLNVEPCVCAGAAADGAPGAVAAPRREGLCPEAAAAQKGVPGRDQRPRVTDAGEGLGKLGAKVDLVEDVEAGRGAQRSGSTRRVFGGRDLPRPRVTDAGEGRGGRKGGCAWMRGASSGSRSSTGRNK